VFPLKAKDSSVSTVRKLHGSVDHSNGGLQTESVSLPSGAQYMVERKDEYNGPEVGTTCRRVANTVSVIAKKSLGS